MRAFWLTSYEPPVQVDLFKLGLRNLLINAVADAVLPCLVAASAWRIVDHATILHWLGLALAGDALAWGMWLAWRPTAHLNGAAVVARMKVWQWTHIATVCLMGATWGYVGVLFVPTDPVHNLLMIAGFQGVLAYSAASNASHELLAFIVSLLCAGLVMTLYVPQALLHQASYMYWMLWLYLGALCVVAVNSHQTILVSIRLRLANEVLAKKNAETAQVAQQANRDKSEFLAAASHDLRQPVHALLLLIEALRAKERDTPVTADIHQIEQAKSARGDLISHISAAGQAIASLFNALMELSRLESGREQTLMASVTVTHLLTQCVQRHAMQARQKGLDLRLWVAPSVQSAVTQTDRVLLERMVGNLLSNALTYTDKGGVLASLRRGAQGALLLEVWDTGVGIADEHADRVFAPYFQVGNRERDRSKGLGLGLAIVRQSAQLLGMTLQLRSKPGQGSRFRLEIPNWQVEQAADLEPLVSNAPLDVDALRDRRVLLIDDDPMVRHAMQTLLASWQVELKWASHADDPQLLALRQSLWRPDCILCDYRLPGSRHGIALLNELLDVWPEAVGILQTGELAEQVHANAEDAGYAVLFKPVPAPVLASTLRAVLPVCE